MKRIILAAVFISVISGGAAIPAIISLAIMVFIVLMVLGMGYRSYQLAAIAIKGTAWIIAHIVLGALWIVAHIALIIFYVLRSVARAIYSRF